MPKPPSIVAYAEPPWPVESLVAVVIVTKAVV